MARPSPPPSAVTVAGIAGGQRIDLRAVGERGEPAHRRIDRAGVGALDDLQRGHDRAAHDQPDALERPRARATARSAPTPSPTWPPPTATSQPSASFIEIDSASGLVPVGQRHPLVHFPAVRRATDLLDAVGEVVVRSPGPIATSAGPHDRSGRCARSPAMRPASVPAPRRRGRRTRPSTRRVPAGRGPPNRVLRAAASPPCPSRRRSVSVKSASTCSRSSPRIRRTDSTSSSASTISRSSTTNEACSSARKAERSASEARPSAIDQIADSS